MQTVVCPSIVNRSSPAPQTVKTKNISRNKGGNRMGTNEQHCAPHNAILNYVSEKMQGSSLAFWDR